MRASASRAPAAACPVPRRPVFQISTAAAPASSSANPASSSPAANTASASSESSPLVARATTIAAPAVRQAKTATRRLTAAARDIGCSRIRRRMPPRRSRDYLVCCPRPASASCAVTWPLTVVNTLGSSPSTAEGMQVGSQE